MALSSMTAFARTQGPLPSGGDWTWEIRSVNGRGLDLRFRLPPGHEGLEPKLRSAVQERFARGSVQANLTLKRDAARAQLAVNEVALDQVSRLAKDLEKRLGLPTPTADGLLALKGVLELREPEETEADRSETLACLEQGFLDGLDALKAARAEEGHQLGTVVDRLIGEISGLVTDAKKPAENQPSLIRARLEKSLSDLREPGQDLPEERIAQEVAMLAGKACVREEIDRLDIHISAAKELLASSEPVGRKFDFLVQEFHREANTLCSKSADPALTRCGLALKTTIDQLREQVQNIE